MSENNLKKSLGTINRFLERAIPITTPLAIVLGFLLPDVFIQLRPFVFWLFGLMTFSGALKLTVKELGAVIKAPLVIVLFFICAHVVMPVFARLAAPLFFTDTDIVTGFVLLFASPVAVSVFFWIIIFNGNKALALSLILLDTLLAPIVVPGTISILMGAKIQMDMSGIAFSLIMMIVIPTIIGIAVNELTKTKLQTIVSPYLDPISKIFLMMVVAANASVLVDKVQFADPLLWKVAVVCIALTAAGFVLAKITAIIGKCDEDTTIAMVFAGGLRNNNAVMTLAVTFFPEAAALPTLACVIIQQTLAAVAGKIFARKKSDKP